MGVFKVGRYWYACFSYKGVHHQESLHVEHKYEALRIFAKWKSSHHLRSYTQSWRRIPLLKFVVDLLATHDFSW